MSYWFSEVSGLPK